MSPSPWYQRTPAELCQDFDCTPETGLADEEARRRLAADGPNEIPAPPAPSLLSRVLAQLRDPLVGALLVAAAVAAAVAASEASAEPAWLRYADATAILLIVGLNAALGVLQERRAEEALAALRELAAPRTRVLRGSKLHDIEARELVVGDVVQLEAGDAVPADLRLLEAAEVTVEESALTGESVPVQKDAEAPCAPDAPLPERATALYLGTRLLNGTATAVVAATGANTELGRIGALVSSAEELQTPLQERLDAFGHRILLVCILCSLALFAVGWWEGTRPWTTVLLTAVSLAVAAIPEGLPAVTSVTLALGVRRMADRGAVVRSLPAVETLGSATVICTDKTGTLTQNALSVHVIEVAGRRYRVEGAGFSPAGEVLEEHGTRSGELPLPLRELIECGVRCNHAELTQDEDGTWRPIGDPTEAALVVLARRAHHQQGAGEIDEEHPFDSVRKRMCVVVRTADGLRTAHVKGSPESILARCEAERTEEGVRPLDEARRSALAARAEDLAGQGLRVLALARHDDLEDEDPEADLVWLGLVGIRDQPRPGVPEAIAACHRAGIRVVMITGDHRRTAETIAQEMGLWQEDSLAFEGKDLAGLEAGDLDGDLGRVAVFARVSPEQKLEIVRALRRTGEVVAMTGDGVNDAPALREAHIGVAMGKTGTDVAREAAEMVLLDDDFTTIVAAVTEGRILMENVRRFVVFLLGANAGLVLAVLAAAPIPWLVPLTPLQLLWINLVTNGLPALALGVEPGDESVLDRPPQPPGSPLLAPEHLGGMAIAGAVMGVSGLLVSALPAAWPDLYPGLSEGEALGHSATLTFMVLALGPLVHAFNCRRLRTSLASTGLTGNPWLWKAVGASLVLQLATLALPGARTVFRTHVLTGPQWVLVVGLALAVIPVMELQKWVARRGARGCEPGGASLR